MPNPVEPPLDLGPLPDAVGYLLRRAQILVFQGFHEAFDAFGVRPAQFSVLVLVAKNPGVRAASISAALAIKRANLVPVLDEFERRGLIRRETLSDDRRAQGLYLTDDGAAFVARLLNLQDRLERSIEEKLGKSERAKLVSLLRRLAASLGQPGPSR